MRYLIVCFPSAIQKVEQEKTNRDHTIRSLNDEIANQDEVTFSDLHYTITSEDMYILILLNK